MVYDVDLNPEGLALTFDHEIGDDWGLFGYASWYIVDELGSSEDDPWMLDFMLGAWFDCDCWNGKFALGYYYTEHLENADCEEFLGNYGQAGGGPTRWYGDFSVLRLFAELTYAFCDDHYLCTPALVTFAGGYVVNLSDDYDVAGVTDERQGWTAQVKYGKAKEPSTWEAAVQYKHLEADATIDQFTDSDWGRGETNRKGWAIKAKLALCKWWNISGKAFFTERIKDRELVVVRF